MQRSCGAGLTVSTQGHRGTWSFQQQSCGLPPPHPRGRQGPGGVADHRTPELARADLWKDRLEVEGQVVSAMAPVFLRQAELFLLLTPSQHEWGFP